jgi:uncharacterized protein YraI
MKKVAAVGAVVAVSAAATMALVAGSASADVPGRCTVNVNVRAEPSLDAKIIALCESGTQVQVGESKDGFLKLTNLKGWAAQQYVSVNGRSPAAPAKSESDVDTTKKPKPSSDDDGSDENSSDGDDEDSGQDD